MSSTSSSDCENCDCRQCTYLFDDSHNTYSQNGKFVKISRHVPIYTTMAHPLIYYAEVVSVSGLHNGPCLSSIGHININWLTSYEDQYDEQPQPLRKQRPLNRRQTNDQPRKENQNYFVKAFKWYTQERVSSNKNDDVSERSGFANWLDYKYVEYLRESRQHQLRAQETSTIEPCAPCPSPYEACTTRRFARIRSPWRKRRRPCNDFGDVPEKCTNQICEFIMQPKDLTRAASDNCYHTPKSGCIKSNATLVSSNVPGNLRCSGGSRSLSSVCRDISVPQHIDTIPHTAQEGPRVQETITPQEPIRPQKPINPQEPIKPQEPSKLCCEYHQELIQKVPSKLKPRAVDVSCQCPEEKVIPVNVQTQYKLVRLEPSIYTEPLAQCYCIVDTGDTPMPMPVMMQRRKISNPEISPTLIHTQNYALKKQKQVKQSSISCQCPEKSIVKVDTQCQYQPDRDVNFFTDPKEVNQVFGPKPIRRQSYSTVNEETCERAVKEAAVDNKLTRSLTTCVANDAAQTSDHAIYFEKGAYLYPLFLKMLYAERLNKECF